MLKDIYSPLEIDEEWDQRAPAMEGDTAAAGIAVEAQASDPQTQAQTQTMETDLGKVDIGAGVSDQSTMGEAQSATVSQSETPTITHLGEENIGAETDNDSARTTLTTEAETNETEKAEIPSTLGPGDTIQPEIKAETQSSETAARATELGIEEPEEKQPTTETEEPTGLQSIVEEHNVVGDEEISTKSEITAEEHTERGKRLEEMSEALKSKPDIETEESEITNPLEEAIGKYQEAMTAEVDRLKNARAEVDKLVKEAEERAKIAQENLNKAEKDKAEALKDAEEIDQLIKDLENLLAKHHKEKETEAA